MRRTTALLGAAALALGGACHRGADEPIRIAVTKRGFEPYQVKAQAGKPVTLVLTRTTDETCATEIVIPEAGIDARLPLGQPVTVTFTPKRAGQIRYACAMNMFQGVIDVR